MRPSRRIIIAHALKTALIAAICIVPIFAARAATVGTPAEVVIVRPLSLVKTDDLRFGSIIPGGAAGTVTINAATGVRTSTGPIVLASSDHGPAHFVGLGGATVLVFFRRIGTGPITLTRAGGGATMTLNSLTGLPALRLFPGSGILTFDVGGTLAVTANQPAGVYSGTFDVQLNYF